MECRSFTVEIERFYEVKSPKDVVFYTIRVNYLPSALCWTIDKRYSNFDNLCSELTSKFISIPPLPAKTFWRRTSTEFLEERRQQLEEFLKYIMARPEILASEELRDFLRIHDYVPAADLRKPEKLIDFPMESRITSSILSGNYLIVASSDLDWLSSMDFLLLNRKAKSSKSVPISSVVLYRMNLPRSGIEEVWRIPITSRITSMVWSEELTILCIGCADGSILSYRISTELDWAEYSEFCNVQLHTEAIISLKVNYRNSIMYSCSADSSLSIIRLNTMNVFKTLELPSNNPIGMDASWELERLYVAMAEGNILIFDISNEQPVLKFMFVTSNPPISAVSFDISQKKIYLASNSGTISVYGKSPGNREMYRNLEILMVSKPDISCIQYIPSKKEVAVGYKSGNICFFNAVTGLAIYVWKAHDDGVLSIEYFEDRSLLVTTGGDKRVSIWNLTLQWRDPEDVNRELANLETALESEHIQKIKRNIKKDDLKGWNR